MIRRAKGFTLVEIMIVVVIVGILAAVAIPAYQRYVVEAKLADVLEYAGVAKLAMTEYYESTGECPTAEKAGLTVDNPIPHILNVSSAWDRIPCRDWFEVYLEIDGDSDSLLKQIDGERVMMRAELEKGGVKKWTCGFSKYTPEIKEYLPSSCQHEMI